MCGIAGILRFDNEPVDTGLLGKMAETMAPRGPDGSGVTAYGRVGFAHRRLKIIDLSENARQPMVDPDLGLTIVFNGCIYNHKELRATLVTKGYRFFSQGDTEVILKAYHAWGRDCVDHLNGMFAFAILERDTGNAFLARDRLGIKPLYYSQQADRLSFASSLRALMTDPDVSREIDPKALYYYMSFHAVVPPPHTIYEGVRKLPPATRMFVSATGDVRQERYWRADFSRSTEPYASYGEADWEAAVEEALTLSVKRRLVADVPVGVLLSGGLDSSLVVGLLANAGQSGLKTFSIGFETVGDEKGDEFQYSDIIAKHYGTDHTKISIDSQTALPALQATIGAMEEPMVSHDCVGFFLLSQEVAKHVKVVQSGQGADEVFAGYHWYPPLAGQDKASALALYKEYFFDRPQEEMQACLQPHWLEGDPATDFVATHFKGDGAQTAVDQALRIDSEIMLVDDPVKRVDNMTMAWGLEARVPFLDHELVELSARVPPELKLADEGKGILKKIGRRTIPTEVIDRPKGYFPVPALKYLRGPFLELVRDAVTDGRFVERNLFRPDYVETLLAAPEEHLTPLRGSKLWQIGLLALWLNDMDRGATGE